MEIQIREPCLACRGDGMVQAWQWAEFWALPNAQKMSPDEVWAWFVERGYTVSCKGLYGEQMQDFPPEEILCPDCEGRLTIARWIPLSELATLLKGERK